MTDQSCRWYLASEAGGLTASLNYGIEAACVAYLYDYDETGSRYLAPGTDALATLPPYPFVAHRPAPRRA